MQIKVICVWIRVGSGTFKSFLFILQPAVRNECIAAPKNSDTKRYAMQMQKMHCIVSVHLFPPFSPLIVKEIIFFIFWSNWPHKTKLG